ncbi:DUF4190 domain-containing protein [Cellulomonas sp. CW35]|uniref:DUF4190 domain-containing protein n=1 Tax=Cellulomonas sp. CW35 TaxID=3458249 RepID=UPI0040336F41
MSEQPPAPPTSPDPYPATHYAPTWSAAARPPLEGLAVAALVAALLFWLWPTLGLVGLGLGVAALRATRAKGTRGRGLARAAVVVGAVGALVALGATAAVVVAVQRSRPIATDVSGPVTTTVNRLDAGHCVRDLPSDGPVSEIVVVPCGDKHEAEVRARVTVRSQQPWPGQTRVDELVRQACELDEHYARTGEPLDVVWSPDESGWNGGDRLGLCVQRTR